MKEANACPTCGAFEIPAKLLDEHDLRIDRREIRAMKLANHILHILRAYIPEHCQRDAYNVLASTLHRSGADVVLDSDRSDAGLPMRDERGWTRQELLALEHKRLELMMKPIIVTANTQRNEISQ